MKQKNTTIKKIATNKKAYHDFTILSKLECGLVLQGCEVKSIRAGHISLNNCYARIINSELWLLGCHIKPYAEGGQFSEIDPTRNRKLLIHKNELKRLIGKVQEKGFSLIPLQVYFKQNKAKLEIGLAKSKKHYDKRQVIKDKENKRDLDRALKHYKN